MNHIFLTSRKIHIELKYCLKLVWCFKFWIDNFLRNSIKSSSLINIYGYCFLCLSVTNFIYKLNIADNKPKSRNLTSVTQVIHGKGPVEAWCFCFQTCWYLILNSDRKTCTSVVQIMMLLCKNAWSQFQSNTHTDAQIIQKSVFWFLKRWLFTLTVRKYWETLIVWGNSLPGTIQFSFAQYFISELF